jgi:dynactin complex subunit
MKQLHIIASVKFAPTRNAEESEFAESAQRFIIDELVAENTALKKQIREMAGNIVDLVAENSELRKRNKIMEQRNAQDALRINALLSTVSKLVNKQLL